MTFGLPKTSLLACAALAAREDGRYALSCILAEPGRAVGTDGRALIVVESPVVGEGEPILIPRKIAGAVGKAGGLKPLAEIGAVGLTAWGRGGKEKTFAFPQPENGRFPKWREVFPTDLADHRSYTVDARLLADALLAVACHAGEDGNVVLTVPVQPDRSPLLISAAVAAGNRAAAAVMPCEWERVNGETNPAAEWLPGRERG